MAGSTAPETTETPLDKAVREAVEAAPPLSPEARDELVRLLSKGGHS